MLVYMFGSDYFFKEAIRQDPNNTAAHYSLGNFYLYFQKTWLAEVAFRTALKCDPNYAQAHVHLGTYYQQQKQFTEAEVCFKQAINDDTKLFEARLNFANILMLNDRFDEALHQLLEITIIPEEDKHKIGFFAVNMQPFKNGK